MALAVAGDAGRADNAAVGHQAAGNHRCPAAARLDVECVAGSDRRLAGPPLRGPWRPAGAALALVLLAGFAILGGIMMYVVSQFIVGVPELVNEVTRSIDTAKKWLIEGR